MEDRNREYSNDDITVFWKPGKCIHATTCYRELIEVFNPRKRPWVNMEGASTEKIIEIIRKCPTDALTFKWKDESKNNLSDNTKVENTKSESYRGNSSSYAPVTVSVMRDGPLVVQGTFEVYDSHDNKLKHMKMTSLCRCGASNNPPFCDGFHRKIGFTSE